MSVRGQLAETWVDELQRLSSLREPPTVPTAVANQTEAPTLQRASDEPMLGGLASRVYDEQALRGLATRVAVHEMLHDLSLLPSQRHLHDYLSKFVLLNHRQDLCPDGSVERLLLDLAAQPLHIRGSSLIDPMQLEIELLARTAEITDQMAVALEDTKLDHTKIQGSFLEGCLVRDFCCDQNLLEGCFLMDNDGSTDPSDLEP